MSFYTRRGDVMTPIRQFSDQAFNIMLPFCGVDKKAERRKAIRQGSVHALANLMKECRREDLAEKMDAFDIGRN